MNLYRDLIESKTNSYVYMAAIYHYKGKSKELFDKFIKIGYTSTSPEQRFRMLPSCFQVKHYSVWKFPTEKEAKRVEKRLHELFVPYKYMSKHYTRNHHKWGGYQETFNSKVITEFEIISQIGTDNLFKDQELLNYEPLKQLA